MKATLTFNLDQPQDVEDFTAAYTGPGALIVIDEAVQTIRSRLAHPETPFDAHESLEIVMGCLKSRCRSEGIRTPTGDDFRRQAEMNKTGCRGRRLNHHEPLFTTFPRELVQGVTLYLMVQDGSCCA